MPRIAGLEPSEADSDIHKIRVSESASGRTLPRRTGGPEKPLPPEYWQSLLQDPRALPSGLKTAHRRLSEIPQHLLRVACRRCGRTVEIQKVDAIRLAGAQAVWKDLGQRLLDDTCTQRTGRHEEDGCWPSFE
jgi:hypothetical protein